MPQIRLKQKKNPKKATLQVPNPKAQQSQAPNEAQKKEKPKQPPPPVANPNASKARFPKETKLLQSKVPKCGAQEGGEDSTSHFHNAQKKKTIAKTRNHPLNNSDTFSQNVGPTAEPVRVANPEGQQSQAPGKAEKKKNEKKYEKKEKKKDAKKDEKKDEKIDLLGGPRVCHAYFSLVDENRASDRFQSIFGGEQVYGGGGGLPVQQTPRERIDVSFRNVSQEFPAWADASGERLQDSRSSTNEKFMAGMIFGALLSLCIVWIGFKVFYVLAFLGIV